MKLILEISSFSILDKIESSMKEIFQFVSVKNNTIYCSNILDKGGNPVVRIDSKRPCRGLMLKVTNDCIIIKSIVNSTDERGFAKRCMDIVINLIPPHFKVIIDQDVSGGFWDYLIQKYPNVSFQK